jgi:hypothetical protein
MSSRNNTRLADRLDAGYRTLLRESISHGKVRQLVTDLPTRGLGIGLGHGVALEIGRTPAMSGVSITPKDARFKW